MTHDSFTQAKTALLSLGGQRVWSLMVTLFGDLAHTSSGAIDGPQLSAIMAAMEVRPEAVRVALHRLRNDGWIVSEKHGRTRRHTLTPASLRETQQAGARIYARPQAKAGAWHLALLDPDTQPPADMLQRGFSLLMPRVYLGGAQARAPQNALVLAGGEVPHWLRDQVAQTLPVAEYTALLPVLDRIEAELPADALDPRDITVLRCLLVHNWRRIVLRHAPLPPALLPENWVGQQCHHKVDTLLRRFPAPATGGDLPD